MRKRVATEDVEGAQTRPVAKPRGRPRERLLLDPSHPLHFGGCSACLGLGYKHSAACQRFRTSLMTDAGTAERFGISAEEIERWQAEGLLPTDTATASGA
eukprot:2358891-Amphidinium_carterae.1